jgi:hypothetical protein
MVESESLDLSHMFKPKHRDLVTVSLTHRWLILISDSGLCIAQQIFIERVIWLFKFIFAKRVSMSRP